MVDVPRMLTPEKNRPIRGVSPSSHESPLTGDFPLFFINRGFVDLGCSLKPKVEQALAHSFGEQPQPLPLSRGSGSLAVFGQRKPSSFLRGLNKYS